MSIAEITTHRGTRPSQTRQSGRRFTLPPVPTSPTRVRVLASDEPETGCSATEVVRLTQLTSLPDRGLRLVRPIPAVVERLDRDNYVAEAPDADVCASGDTAEEAIRNLEDMVAATFAHFSMVPEERLGRIPARQLRVLKHHIRRR